MIKEHSFWEVKEEKHRYLGKTLGSNMPSWEDPLLPNTQEALSQLTRAAE